MKICDCVEASPEPSLITEGVDDASSEHSECLMKR